MRLVLGMIVGVALAMATITLVEWLQALLIPLARPVGPDDPGAVAAMPAAAQAMIAFGWFAGALAGAVATIRIARRDGAGWVPPGLVLAGGIAAIVMIDHPWWMGVAAIAAPILGGYAGVRIGSRGRVHNDRSRGAAG